MVRAIVKNTFVELEAEEGDEGAEGLAVKRGARCRSLSAGRLGLRADGEEAVSSEVLLDSLNRVLRVRAPVEPRPAPEKGPAVSELRDLQRRLSDLLAGGSFLGSRGVPSSGSLTTMAPDEEGEEEATSPSSAKCRTPGAMRHVWSLGSVSTAASEPEEARPDEGRRGGRSCKQAVPDAGRAAQPRSADFAHGRVPRSLNLAEEFSKSSQEVPITTLMIRNIPNRYSQWELAQELDELGLAGSYDFLYAPVDKGTMCNVGYTFVNFLSEEWASRCSRVCHGYCFRKYSNQKARRRIAAVSVAHIQGLEANMRHYENSAVCGGHLGAGAAAGRSRGRHGPLIAGSSSASAQLMLAGDA